MEIAKTDTSYWNQRLLCKNRRGHRVQEVTPTQKCLNTCSLQLQEVYGLCSSVFKYEGRLRRSPPQSFWTSAVGDTPGGALWYCRVHVRASQCCSDLFLFVTSCVGRDHSRHSVLRWQETLPPGQRFRVRTFIVDLVFSIIACRTFSFLTHEVTFVVHVLGVWSSMLLPLQDLCHPGYAALAESDRKTLVFSSFGSFEPHWK